MEVLESKRREQAESPSTLGTGSPTLPGPLSSFHGPVPKHKKAGGCSCGFSPQYQTRTWNTMGSKKAKEEINKQSLWNTPAFLPDATGNSLLTQEFTKCSP